MPVARAPERALKRAQSRRAPVEEVRKLKRIVMVGVYGAIFGFIPFYAFVMHYTPGQLVISTFIGLGIAVCAIEGAFSQMYKLRKRGSYPSMVVVEVGGAKTVAEAAHQVLDVTSDVLDADASWLAFLDDAGVPHIEVRRGVENLEIIAFFEQHEEEIADVIDRRTAATIISKRESGDRGVVTVIPILAWQRAVGLMAVISAKPCKDTRDPELINGIAVAAGLSIENVRQRENLKDALSVLSATLDSTADGIFVVDRAGKIVSFNRRFCDMWRVPEEVLLASDDKLVRTLILDQVEDAAEVLRKSNELYADPETESFDVLQFKDGRVYERYSQPQTVAGEITGRVWCFRDVTERKQSEETIRHLAYHDALTDLPNRALFTDRLMVALAQSRRVAQRLAVMFLDIDRFKLINDTLGHAAGDELLRAIARELGALVREGDTVARVGGDEFILLLTVVEGPGDLTAVANRVLETVRQPRTIAGQEIQVTTSLGVAVFPGDGRDVETLLRNADTAMYRAKQQGRDQYQTYTPAMRAEILQRVSLEADLRRAIEREEFVLHYQPQIDRETLDITGAEALIRWQHPKRGLIYPSDFIPVAEDTGLIIPIGEWVLRAACEAKKRWRDGGNPVTVTVNLSALQFQQPNLVEGIRRVVADTGIDPNFLELEITERMTIQDPDFASHMLEDLRAMGVRVSIDDFGTGYSSLGYLKRFKIDRLKIDRSFVRDLSTDPNDAAIATAMIVMAHSLGLTVVAEGVETPEQISFLMAHGCDSYQGYLTGRPVPERDFALLLDDRPGFRDRVRSLLVDPQAAGALASSGRDTANGVH